MVLKKELESFGFNCNAWNDESVYRTGHVADPKLFVLGYSVALLILFGSSNGKFNTMSIFIYLISLLIGGLVVWQISSKYRFQFIETYRNKLGYFKHGRYDGITYELTTKDVKYIELVFTDKLNLSHVVFNAKSSANLEVLSFNVDVDIFDKKENIPHHFMLYCLKWGINLKIRKENDQPAKVTNNENLVTNNNSSNSLFIRIDKKITSTPLSPDVYQNHMEYLKNIYESSYLMSGEFKDIAGGIIIFCAQNIEDAHIIAKNDPIIITGVYSYDLHPWQVKLNNTDFDFTHQL